MPIFLITSPTGVPVSACRSAKAICSSLYRVFFIRQPSLQAAHFAGFSLSSPGPLFGEDLITTSSGIDANGGSQGAVGDRRAAICGANAPGAGGLYPSAECGRLVLYSTRHFSITICASFSE